MRFLRLIKSLWKDFMKSLKGDPLDGLRYERYEPDVLGNKLKEDRYRSI